MTEKHLHVDILYTDDNSSYVYWSEVKKWISGSASLPKDLFLSFSSAPQHHLR